MVGLFVVATLGWDTVCSRRSLSPAHARCGTEMTLVLDRCEARRVRSIHAVLVTPPYKSHAPADEEHVCNVGESLSKREQGGSVALTHRTVAVRVAR